MDFETRTALDGNVVVIEMPELLNFDVADILRSKLKSLVENKQFRIVIDLTRTKYVDSSGLGAMVSRIAMARSNGGDIRFA
ncbi:STAS domain-containing protein, partial [candidate division KSB1 bacterium]|nr:STAS domain-containing protein [candidate division KSB1 bacterium]NIR71638.1 STAS domain-containing protein [candidate division KSB1 bacterium]NIS23457.1 STAS domain-containing protein [candidate division KSB1 bacterium]NIT70367.1 STAS domain-containing protein [candidate division KSB1 bacterium]NIU24066.1 STAS domain-containing protein [candidate division KSB1 bacterium]